MNPYDDPRFRSLGLAKHLYRARTQAYRKGTHEIMWKDFLKWLVFMAFGLLAIYAAGVPQ